MVAISINVVGWKHALQVYETMPNGCLGIQWDFAYWRKGNLQVRILHVIYLSFLLETRRTKTAVLVSYLNRRPVRCLHCACPYVGEKSLATNMS